MEKAKLKHVLGNIAADADDPGLNASAKVKLLAEVLVAQDAEIIGWGVALANAVEGRVDLATFNSAVNTILATLEKKADKSALDSVWRAAENSFATRQVEASIASLSKDLGASLSRAMEATASKADFLQLVTMVDAHVSASPSHADLLSSLNILASKIDALKSAVIAHAAKLDTDFNAQNLAVTNSDLDEDYETTVTSALA